MKKLINKKIKKIIIQDMLVIVNGEIFAKIINRPNDIYILSQNCKEINN